MTPGAGEGVCSSWSHDPDYCGDGLRFTCGCGEMTGIYPDHAAGEAVLDRHLDEQDAKFRRRIADTPASRRRLPRLLRRKPRWQIRYLGR